MRRTSWGARAYVKRSGVPVTAWAKLLGINRISMHKLIAGDTRMMHGPAMQRLIQILDNADATGRGWERIGPRMLTSSWEFRAPTGTRMQVQISTRIAETIRSLDSAISH